MIEHMRDRLITLAKAAEHTKAEYYKNECNVKKLRAMDEAERAFHAALCALSSKEFIELIRKD